MAEMGTEKPLKTDSSKPTEVIADTNTASGAENEAIADALAEATRTGETQLTEIDVDQKDANGSSGDAEAGDEKGSDGAQVQAPNSPSMPPSPLFGRFPVVATLNLYDVSKYTFGTKAERQRNGRITESQAARESHLESRYKEWGMRRSVGAVLLLQNHRFPHILLLQAVKGSKEFFLPGGRLKPGESTIDGLRRKLFNKLSPPPDVTESPNFEIGDQVATWWSPDFSRRKYPYIPAHISTPKESHAVYVVQLPETCTFAVPKNFQLLAVPLFEIYDNMEQYGPVITAVPVLLSRFHVNFIGS
eukprot:Plantae.Rhodophyta-Purpureofilum_apyrenoidigerum.ctg25206.p1 GENE.Plantae.Rhodophyta-Purpureofilum_apyrenoidigerum.ctg25206~~Plantae.Rhodophyta-Purpureofilum_apyrenoidigerum.ctg25206.p1  ORF type:complete len:303 (+),score=45.68 Plantae.Rhodophyta-Purpureofilum_apyrenoidigerum.ctg25206:335-1243(+)